MSHLAETHNTHRRAHLLSPACRVQKRTRRAVRRIEDQEAFEGGEATSIRAGTGQLTVRVLSLAQMTLTTSEPGVEQLQDLVEDVLLTSPFKKTAKAYILYRDQHARIRELVQKADVDLIDNYLNRLDWQVQENSNMSYSLQGLNNYISSEISKTSGDKSIRRTSARHASGDFHLHDLGMLSVYCVRWDLHVCCLALPGRRGQDQAVPPGTSTPPQADRPKLPPGRGRPWPGVLNVDTLLAPFIHRRSG